MARWDGRDADPQRRNIVRSTYTVAKNCIPGWEVNLESRQ